MSSGQDVRDVYAATLGRIRAQETGRARLGMDAIMWVAYSGRPLSPDELCQALGVQIGSTDLDSGNIPSIRTILNCGLGLVTVDSSSSVVRLVHFTLQEHILDNPTLFRGPHTMIAMVCLTYLNFGCIRAISPALRSPPPTASFLGYASRYWGEHARRQTSISVVSLALNLLDGFEAHISCELLLRREFRNSEHWDVRHYDGPIECTALHAAAFLGVLEIMISLLKINKWDVNATSSFGITALSWAAEMGRDQIVKVLLEHEGVDPHVEDHSGRTLLSWAASGGRGGGGGRPTEIVGMLLERNDVHPDIADKSGRTPLSWAAGRGFWPLGISEGHESVVKMLLERNEVNPDTADKSGRTPLSWAAGDGCEEIVQMLLERNEVNPDTADKSGRTPLSWAAWNGCEKIVRTLLERNDVNPDSTTEDGRTPLSCAAGPRKWSLDSEKVYGRIVKILLERNDVNPDSADKGGRTPLSWAATSGHGEVVRMLLERNDVNLNAKDGGGRTPLSWAANSGHEEIVWFLLERNDVLPNTPDEGGQTTFTWATGNDCEKVAQEQAESHDLLSISEHREELPGLFATDPSPLPEPPLKKRRRF